MFRKTGEQIHGSLESNKNNGYRTGTPINIFYNKGKSVPLQP